MNDEKYVKSLGVGEFEGDYIKSAIHRMENDLSAGAFYEICSNETTFMKYVTELLAYSKQSTIQEVKKLITDEINICREENTPTSRLTSLYNKVTSL